MFLAISACAFLIAFTTLIHYEALRLLNAGLPMFAMQDRAKLLVAVMGTFLAHLLEIGAYGITVYFLLQYANVGTLETEAGLSLSTCLYFSAETYTSLGFGDITPMGPIRLLAGIEALNGLLLVGWSASFLYLSMEKFWNTRAD